MMNRKLLSTSLIAILALLLAACGGSGDSGSTTDGGDAAAASVDLSQSIDLESIEMGVSATVKYPKDWAAATVSEAGMIVVGSDETIVNGLAAGAGPSEPPEDAGFVMIQVLAPDMAALMGIAEDASLADAVNVMAGMMSGEGGDFGEVSEITVNGVTVAQAEIVDQEADGIVYVVKSGDAIVFGTGVASKGKLGNYRDTFAAVVASAVVK